MIKSAVLITFFVFLQFSQSFYLENNFRDLVQKNVHSSPFSFDDWDKNTYKYFGYYLKLTLKENQVIEVEFSVDTPQKVLSRNEELLIKLNTAIQESNLEDISDGVHVFPMLCEIITIPKKELQNNLENEMEKTIPDPQIIGKENPIIHKPILVKIYPPRR